MMLLLGASTPLPHFLPSDGSPVTSARCQTHWPRVSNSPSLPLCLLLTHTHTHTHTLSLHLTYTLTLSHKLTATGAEQSRLISSKHPPQRHLLFLFGLSMKSPIVTTTRANKDEQTRVIHAEAHKRHTQTRHGRWSDQWKKSIILGIISHQHLFTLWTQ